MSTNPNNSSPAGSLPSNAVAPVGRLPAQQKKARRFDFSARLETLRSKLAEEKQGEEKINAEITSILSKCTSASGGTDISRSFNLAVTRLNNQMALIESDAKQLANSLQMISGLADNISGKVSQLDVAKCRVVECLQRVGDLRDLRLCTEGVQAALDQEDYEQAAQHIHRFLMLDSAVFQMGENLDGKDGKSTGQSMKHSYEVLRQAQTDLKNLIETKFDEAVAAGDVASMQRFFKLFPLLNEHTNGLQRFGKYLGGKIAKMGDDHCKIMQAGGTDDKRRNVLYADTLTMLFEGIARLIEVHQPLVDSYYGSEKLLILVELLQTECDRQSDRIISAFIKHRQYESKAKLIERQGRQQQQADGKMDALELDVLLSEVTLMHTRAELYWRFLRRRVGDIGQKKAKDGEEQKNRDDMEMTPDERATAATAAVSAKIEREMKLDQLFNRSILGTRMQELLGRYISMEQYYMSESLAKAIEMDQRDAGSLTSTMVDDVFFVIRKCVRRSLSSSSVDCVCAMLNNGVTALDLQFIAPMVAIVKNGYPSVGWTAEAYQTAQTAITAIQQGPKAASEVAGPEKQREIFITTANNLRASTDLCRTLKNGLHTDFGKHLTQINDVEKGKLEHALGQFDDSIKRFMQSANAAIEQICVAAIRPKLKASADQFLDTSHTLTESEFTDFESEDPFIDNLISTVGKAIGLFEPLLVQDNYQELLAIVCAEVSKQFERVLHKAVFNRLGALNLDRELRQLTTYLTGTAGWTVREKTSRLAQIVSVINVDSVDEAVEYYQQLHSSNAHGRVLTPAELRKALALRVDLPAEAIRNMKL